MLRDECVEVAPTWAQNENENENGNGNENENGNENGNEATAHESEPRFRRIDRELRAIAKRRSGLDVEEARWLREAERQRIWRKLGYSTALEYLEDVFGYAPRTAMERLRVAKELGDLPELESELRNGALPYSAAKELTRVMTRATETAWLARARGKNLRDIEELVAGHAKGDTPDTPKNPALINRRRTLELPPGVDAMLEQCRALLADQTGEHVDDPLLVEALCRAFLAPQDASDERKAPRPAYRIVIYICEQCGRAHQASRGRHVELRPSERECAECDAEIVEQTDDDIVHQTGDVNVQQARDVIVPQAGDVNEDSALNEQPKARTKITSAIPQRIRNKVWARDQGRCRVPGCRATRNLDIHHLVHREHGGDHHPANLVVLCSGHHKLHHEGLLKISGRAPDELVFTREGKPLNDARSPSEHRASASLHVMAKHSRFDDVVKLEQAKQALVQLRYKKRDAAALLREVSAHVGANATVDQLVKAVLARSAQQTTHIDDDDVFQLAERALVQLGFTSALAKAAVAKSSAHVGAAPTVDEIIRLALRHC